MQNTDGGEEEEHHLNMDSGLDGLMKGDMSDEFLMTFRKEIIARKKKQVEEKERNKKEEHAKEEDERKVKQMEEKKREERERAEREEKERKRMEEERELIAKQEEEMKVQLQQKQDEVKKVKDNELKVEKEERKEMGNGQTQTAHNVLGSDEAKPQETREVKPVPDEDDVVLKEREKKSSDSSTVKAKENKLKKVNINQPRFMLLSFANGHANFSTLLSSLLPILAQTKEGLFERSEEAIPPLRCGNRLGHIINSSTFLKRSKNLNCLFLPLLHAKKPSLSLQMRRLPGQAL